ncbi:MAG: chaperonin GroEL [Lachnospiraceae bacterium]|nr:chaperonin GroEL [Lachnospiraceae bacterium]
MGKEILNSQEIQKKILQGVNLAGDAVRTAFGPLGRNALVWEEPGAVPFITDNGALIAEKIKTDDRAVAVGVQLIWEAGKRTRDQVGDGSVTTMVLAQAMIQEGMHQIAAGTNPVELKKGMQGAAQVAAAAIHRLSVPIQTQEELAETAGASAGDQKLGKMIGEALETVGLEGIVTVEESLGLKTQLVTTEGMEFERGYLLPEFITEQEGQTAELDYPLILITDYKLTNARVLLPVLELVHSQGRPLLLIADAIEGEAMGLLAVNVQRGILKAAAVQAPAYGDGRRDRLEDLALFTGGQFISETFGISLQDVTEEMLGSARHVTVRRKSTVILEGGGNPKAILERKKSLRALVRNTDYEFNKKRYEERLAKFSGGVAVIRVGAPTETERKEQRQHIENGIHTARAAQAEGLVPGGGITYVQIMPAVEAYADTLEGDRKIGAKTLLKALEAPYTQLAENMGLQGKAVLAKIRQCPGGTGIQAEIQRFVNRKEARILDAARTLRLALQNAASLTSVLLTTEAGVIPAMPGEQGK